MMFITRHRNEIAKFGVPSRPAKKCFDPIPYKRRCQSLTKIRPDQASFSDNQVMITQQKLP